MCTRRVNGSANWTPKALSKKVTTSQLQMTVATNNARPN